MGFVLPNLKCNCRVASGLGVRLSPDLALDFNPGAAVRAPIWIALEIQSGFRADLKLDSNLLFGGGTAPKSSKEQFEKTAGFTLD
jgi:hypothetical protein